MKITFVGCGNMAKAMIGGILGNHLCEANDITATNSSETSCEKNKQEFGIETSTDNCAAVKGADVIVLSVKPQFYETVIREIKDSVTSEQLVITIAPGKTLAWLREKFGKEVKLVRCMPNTPALVGEGMTGICCNEAVQKEDLEKALAILNSFGKTQIVAEHLMDAVVAVSGSSPAYVFMMIEAMGDAAVAEGLPRAQAYQFAAQAVLGSARMVLETGKHPAELKDMVCSPAGTTIQAVKTLEEQGFRSALMEAMAVCAEKSRNM